MTAPRYQDSPRRSLPVGAPHAFGATRAIEALQPACAQCEPRPACALHDAFANGTPVHGVPDTAQTAVRVVLVESQALLRAGLRAMLALRGGYIVTGEAGDGEAALQVVAAAQPDIVLLDLALPRINGLDVLRHLLRNDRLMPRILVLAPQNVPELAAHALALGARGVVVKHAVETDLFRALEHVVAGREYVGAPIDTEQVERLRRSAGRRAPASLTDREQEVLQLIVGGASASDIADALGISPHTAVRHRANLMRKLDVHNRVELIRRSQELALDR